MQMLCGLCEKDILPFAAEGMEMLLCDKCEVRFAIEMMKRQGTFNKVSLF